MLSWGNVENLAGVYIRCVSLACCVGVCGFPGHGGVRSGAGLCAYGLLDAVTLPWCDRRVLRCAHNRTRGPVRCAQNVAGWRRRGVPSNTCAKNQTNPCDAVYPGCGACESEHNSNYKENLTEQKPTVVYSHERLFRWTGIG